MTAPLSIGLGCRAGAPAEAIVALVRRALRDVDAAAPMRLFTIADKEGERGLRDAAAILGIDLTFLPHHAVAAVAPRVLTSSGASRARFGLPSVSEAAALAGAGPAAVLLVRRLAENGVTCAIAGTQPTP